MASAVADIFRRAAQLNRDDADRRGNVVHLAGGKQLIISGDIHGNVANFSKIVEYAHLRGDAKRHLVLQEIIHGPEDPQTQADRSAELLLRAAGLKISHPEQVSFLIGNHDIAQVTGNEIVKGGKSYCKSFSDGVALSFGHEADEAAEAIDEFLISAPLMLRCPNKVVACHSLPSPDRMELCGCEILERPYKIEDMLRGGALYDWTWGRAHSPRQMEALARRLDAEYFVLAHQHSTDGCREFGPRGMCILSDHEHGCIMHMPTDIQITCKTASAYVRKIASLCASG